MATPNRYSRDNPRYNGLSEVGVAGAESAFYTSPKGKKITRQQRFDHAMKDRRIHQERMNELAAVLTARGDKSTKSPKPARRPPPPPPPKQSGSAKVIRKHNFCQPQHLRNQPPTKVKPANKIKPTVCRDKTEDYI